MNDTRPSETAALWAAVSALTQPTRVQVPRDPDNAVLAELGPAERHAATTRWAHVPSLWTQSTDALTNGTEAGSSGLPLRERSPADLDLMEIRSIIRHTTRHELERLGTRTRRGKNGEPVPFDEKEMRTLASAVIAKEPHELWWFTYRLESWARLLDTYLQASEHKAKPMRLRGASCPNCLASTAVIETDSGVTVVPALVIDFTTDGYARACECLNCGHAWWRGEQMEQLAAGLDNRT